MVSPRFLGVTHALIKDIKLILLTNFLYFCTSTIVELVLEEVESCWSRVSSNQLEVNG